MKVIFEKVRIAFPTLWEARAAESGGKEKFSVSVLYAPDGVEHGQIKKAIESVLVEKHGADKAAAKFKAYFAAGKVWPLRDGDSKPEYAGFPGSMFMNASSERRPKCRDTDGITDLAPSDGKPYAGCYCRVIVDVYEYKAVGGGITAELLGVQFIEDGERLSGGGVAEENDFAAIPQAEGDTPATSAGIFD